MNLKNITVTEINNVLTVYSEKGKHDSMHDRKFYGLSFCEQGSITYIQNGREYNSDKSCAVILPKGGNYLIRRNKTGNFPVINFDCLESLCDEIRVIPVDNTDELISDYERMKRLLYFEGSRAQIFSIFYEIIHKLSTDKIQPVLIKAMHIIKNDYCDISLTNAKLATECNISEVYFRKLFTKHFGISPKQFIIDIRIQAAKKLLSEGALSISLISEKCGFSNQYHFCKLFKKHTNFTPSEYRKKNMIDKI